MAQTIETTPTGATAVTLKSAQISEFLRGLHENEERKLTLKEHMAACFEDFREAIEVKGYSYDSLAKQLKKIDFDPDAGARDRAPSDVPPTTSPAPADAAEPKAADKATDADRPVEHPTN